MIVVLEPKLMFGDAACFIHHVDGELGIDADSKINITQHLI